MATYCIVHFIALFKKKNPPPLIIIITMRKSLICPRTSALQPQSLIPRKMHTNSFASKSDQSRSLITGPCSILIKDFFLRQSWLIPSFFRFIFNCQHSFFFLDVSFLTYTCSLHPPTPTPSEFTHFLLLLISIAIFTLIPFTREMLYEWIYSYSTAHSHIFGCEKEVLHTVHHSGGGLWAWLTLGKHLLKDSIYEKHTLITHYIASCMT